MAAAPAAARAAGGRELARFIAGQCWFQFFIAGVFYSLSPLALPISTAFLAEGGDPVLDGGIVFYGFAVLMVVQSLATCVAIFRVERGPLRGKQRFVTAGYLFWPLGLALLALSVRLHWRWLLLAGAFPCMGISIGIQVGYMHLVVTALMYGEDVNKGHALSGGFCALGALSWNVVFGEVVHSLGFEQVEAALWIFCALHACGVFVGLLFLNPTRYMPSAPDLAGKPEDGSSVDGKSLSIGQLLRDWRVVLFVYVVEAFFFAGLAMKTLMSELFEKVLKLGYIDAVRYSDGCLAAYVVARSASPFLAFGNRVFTLFLVVLTCEGLAYALTPWAVRLEGGTIPIYTSFRVVGGVGFAILKSNTSVLLVRVFGSENVAAVSGIFLATECLVGLGPTLAFSLHMQQVDAGSRSEHSYDAFFYVCAFLVLTSSVGVVALRQTTVRRASRAGREGGPPAGEGRRAPAELADACSEVRVEEQAAPAAAC